MILKGRYAGQCPHCGMMLAEFDIQKDGKLDCPRCKRRVHGATIKPKEAHEKTHSEARG